jgi:hypothetical protein
MRAAAASLVDYIDIEFPQGRNSSVAIASATTGTCFTQPLRGLISARDDGLPLALALQAAANLRHGEGIDNRITLIVRKFAIF